MLVFAAVVLMFGATHDIASASNGHPVPYPFTDRARIAFELPRAEFVTLTVLDMQGAEVAMALRDTLPAGRHVVEFDGAGLEVGAYVVALAYSDVSIRRIIVVKEPAQRAAGGGARER